MPPSLSILVTNFHSAQNAGDAASLQEAVRQLRQAFGECSINIITDQPHEAFVASLPATPVASPAWLCGKDRGRPLWRQILALKVGLAVCAFRLARPNRGPRVESGPILTWAGLAQSYAKADLVVACAGNIFFTSGRFGWPFILSAVQPLLAHLFHRPFYVLSQSLGPLRRGWERRLLAWLYQRARLVLVRESGSLELARELGLPEVLLRLVPDPAFALPAEPPELADAYLAALGVDRDGPLVGVTVIGRMASGLSPEPFLPYYDALATGLSTLVRDRNARVCFFPQVTGPTRQEDDRQAARLVVRAMAVLGCKSFMVEEALDPAFLKALYGRTNCFLATRMHSGIFAVSMGVPTLFVGYLTKARGLARTLGLEPWFVEMDSLTSEYLAARLGDMLDHPAESAATARRALSGVSAAAAGIGELIAGDFHRG